MEDVEAEDVPAVLGKREGRSEKGQCDLSEKERVKKGAFEI